MKKICIIGGDKRLKIAKNLLEKENFFVDSLGLYPEDNGDVALSDILLLPVPTTKDGNTVYTPETNKKIYLSDIEKIAQNKLILCCNYKFEKGKSVDYNTLDSYALLNAVPTAEGAIKLAIENTDFTLWKSKVLIIGFGRVGKILADRLKNLGAFVTVSARNPKDFALLDALGFNYINTESLNNDYLDYDIIFNTVDSFVLNNTALQNCPCNLIIDLSSTGGFDLNFAKTLAITALKPPGLPGKIAPKTAGEILAKTVTELIRFYY